MAPQLCAVLQETAASGSGTAEVAAAAAALRSLSALAHIPPTLAATPAEPFPLTKALSTSRGLSQQLDRGEGLPPGVLTHHLSE